jgi:hypothetical protein
MLDTSRPEAIVPKQRTGQSAGRSIVRTSSIPQGRICMRPPGMAALAGERTLASCLAARYEQMLRTKGWARLACSPKVPQCE